jgi:hypothetical protein
MEVAEDLLLERGVDLQEVTGGIGARNFTIPLKPLWSPSNESKMVQVRIAPAGSLIWVKLYVANGTVRVQRERERA